jgi:transcriptional regulator with XRE-family HTH domain
MFPPSDLQARLTPGRALQILRSMRGCSRSEFARQLGVDLKRLIAFESGTKLDLALVRKAAAVLGVASSLIAFPNC